MGMYLDEIDLGYVVAQVLAEYHESAQRVAPIASKWTYTKKSGRHLKYERVILPLSADGRTVDMFLCGAVGRGVG